MKKNDRRALTGRRDVLRTVLTAPAWTRALGMAAAGLGDVASGAHEEAEPYDLRTDDRVQPLGIDSAVPRLSWKTRSAERGWYQTAYQLQVASSEALLLAGHADVWDSGKVMSREQISIAYEGPAPESRRRYHWRVRVWNARDKASSFSSAASWEMGLLAPADWRASWIGHHDPEFIADRRDVRWIGPAAAGAQRIYIYRRRFDVPALPQRARLLVRALPDIIQLRLNGSGFAPPAAGASGELAVADLSGRLVEGANVFEIVVGVPPGKLTDVILSDAEGGPGSRVSRETGALLALIKLEFDSGEILRIATDDSWESGWSAPTAGAQAAPDHWERAKLLGGLDGDPPLNDVWPGQPAALLRQEFRVSKPVTAARVYATALGSYRLYLNGQPVSRAVLTPDPTDYQRRISYQTYDVTAAVQTGGNAVAALLGDGWYSSAFGFMMLRRPFGPPPNRLLLQLELHYADGTRDTLVSGAGWRTQESAVRSAEIFAGETYDARRERPGWDRAAFDSRGWRDAQEQPAPQAQLAAQPAEPIMPMMEIKPVAMTQPQPGVFVFDLGQNIAGWARLRVRGAAGDMVRLRFAEVLHSDGMLDVANLGAARATDFYILRGDPAGERFEPHFTFHGFRYVEVTGYPGTPTLDAITGIVIHSALEQTGRFHCSNALVNRIWLNALWGQRGNFIGIPTDCPQRSERMGWLGDAQVFWETASFNMNTAAFTRKFLRDIAAAQQPSGAIGDIAPVPGAFPGSPGWADAVILLPWISYRQHADKAVLLENWDVMSRWMNFVREHNPSYRWLEERGVNWGDWLAVDSKGQDDHTTPTDLIATAFWANDARLMAEMAEALGRSAEAAAHRELAEKIRAAFVQSYVGADGTVGNGSQTGYALALDFGLVPEPLRAAATQHLAADIEKRGGHLSTGFLGTPHLLRALSENGRADVAYTLLLQKEFPSWGYMVDHGATTMWERWNADRAAGLMGGGMNSRNHYAYGAVAAWLYGGVAGIAPAAPGFARICINPQIDSRLDFASAEYESPYGTIRAGWQRSAREGLRVAVEIPANTTATITLPARTTAVLMEGRKPLQLAPGVALTERGASYCKLSVGAGRYEFRIA